MHMPSCSTVLLLVTAWLVFGCCNAQPAPPTQPTLAPPSAAPSLIGAVNGSLLSPPIPPTPTTATPTSAVSAAPNLSLLSSVAFSSSLASSAVSSSSVVARVLRSGSSASSVWVNFTTLDVSAVSGVDYGGGSGWLYWPAGDSTQRDITFAIDPSARLSPSVAATDPLSTRPSDAATAAATATATATATASTAPSNQSTSTAVQRQFAVLLFSPVNAILGSPDMCSVVMQSSAALNVRPGSVSSVSSSTGHWQSSAGTVSASTATTAASTAATVHSSTSPSLLSSWSSSSSASSVLPSSASASDSSHLPLALGLALGLGGGLLVAALLCYVSSRHWCRRKAAAAMGQQAAIGTEATAALQVQQPASVSIALAAAEHGSVPQIS